MVEFRRLSINYSVPKRFGKKQPPLPALAEFSARFERGNISCVIGPSGCGKTSLIHAAAGLVKADSGEVLIEGRVQDRIRSGTAVIFQHFGLLPWKSAEANVELPLKIAGVKKKERKQRAARMLEEFGLAPFGSLYPKNLSGGMKQRLALARSLVCEPDLLLMDEPFSSLDALSREEAQDLLLSISRNRTDARGGASRKALTIIMVTHSIEEAVYLAGRIVVMAGKNPGRMAACIDVPRYGRGEKGFLEYCAKLRSYFSRGDAG
jgi:NitT/TauT family transport system ATP-binding protein